MASPPTPGCSGLQKIGNFVFGIAVLLSCQAIGEFLVSRLSMPIPGPIIGLILLLGLLQSHRQKQPVSVERVADFGLRHLQLFFIPAGVGVIAHLPQIRQDALPITAALLLSWLAGLISVALVALLAEKIG